MVASIPFSLGQGMFIPIDDNNCWRYFTAPSDLAEPAQPRRREPVLASPRSPPRYRTATDGIVPRRYTAENDYLHRPRRCSGTSTFSGSRDFVSQDLMVTESMGPIYDRTQEQLGSTDQAISRMRHLLHLRRQGPGRRHGAARRQRRPGLPRRSAAPRRSLSPARTGGTLGTDADPVVREALGATSGEQLTDMVD